MNFSYKNFNKDQTKKKKKKLKIKNIVAVLDTWQCGVNTRMRKYVLHCLFILVETAALPVQDLLVIKKLLKKARKEDGSVTLVRKLLWSQHQARITIYRKPQRYIQVHISQPPLCCLQHHNFFFFYYFLSNVSSILILKCQISE